MKNYSKSLWNHITKKACFVCDVKLIKKDNYHAGHVVSKYHGGCDNLSNLKPLCKTCNLRMSTENMLDYKKRYTDGQIASREEYDRLKSKYGNKSIHTPKCIDLCKTRLESFVATYKKWPSRLDEFCPKEEIKWKNNHVMYLFYKYFLRKERDDYEQYLYSKYHFDYTKYRNDMGDDLVLQQNEYNYIINLSNKYNVLIDERVHKQPWLRQKGRNTNKSKLIIYPLVKDKVYDFINTT